MSGSTAGQQSRTTTPPPLDWDVALSLCRSKLTPEDFEIVCKFGSIVELVEYGRTLQEKYKDTVKAYELTRLSEFLHQLKTFHGSLDIWAHVHPTRIAPLWGSIKLCIELVEEADEVFGLILQMYNDINDTLPRIGIYMDVLDRPESLVKPCREVHVLIAEFSCLVISYFQRHPLKNLALATWEHKRSEFQTLISKMKKKTDQIEFEVKSLSIQANAPRHEEILRLLEKTELRASAKLPCHSIPYTQYYAFTGRQTEMKSVQEHFSTSVGEQRSVALHGLGGVGKTQIALEYVYRHLEDYQAIFWLSADTEVKLGEDVRAALSKLGLISSNGSESHQQCYSLFKDWLLETDVRWILVLDNADDLDVLGGFWLRSSHGHIILTSRDPSASRYPAPSRSMKGVEICALSDTDGVALFLRILQEGSDASGVLDDDGDQDDYATTQSLVAQVKGLPLAINQVASYILDSGCTIEQCFEVYSDIHSRGSLLKCQPNSVNREYDRSLVDVWEFSLSRASTKSPHSVTLFQLLAILDPDGVPEDLLTSKNKTEEGSSRPSLAFLGNMGQLLGASKALMQQSLITKSRPRKGSASLSMHRLMSAMTKEAMTFDERQERFDDATELLYRQFPQVSTTRPSLNDRWPRCQLYIAQVEALEQFYSHSQESLVPSARFGSLLSNACWFLFETGLLAQVMRILPTAQAVGESTMPESRFALATVHRTLGAINTDFIVDPLGALHHFSTVLELQKDIGELVTAHGYTLVALAELALEHYEAAKRDIKIAQDIRTKYGQTGGGFKAMTLDVCGLIEARSGNLDGGKTLLSEASALYDEELGVGNYWTAFANHEIGNILVCLGRDDEAFDYHSRALTVRRDKVGATYRTAVSFHKVAWHLDRRGDEAGAEELLLKAIDIYTNAYEGRRGLSRSNYLMSMILAAQGRVEDARNCKAFAASIRQDLTGIPPGVDDYLESYDDLVGIQDGLAKYHPPDLQAGLAPRSAAGIGLLLTGQTS